MPEPNQTTEALNTLREKLRDMFHFSHNDLDFGIFRILKIKRDEVHQFIQEKLPSIVDKALSQVTDALYDSQLAEVKAYVSREGGATEQAYLNDISGNLQVLIDFLEYKQQDELIAPLQINPEDLKSKLAFRIYNHVHSFFEGYYRDGDFGYNDRSTAQYKVDYPDETNYDGTDTLFHWKCRDSYYVKTATGFNSVPFEIEGKRIEYRLEGKANSSIAQNNNRDDFKHYRFGRIDPPDPDEAEATWRVILHLAETSTPKAEIYREMSTQIFSETDDVDIYLHERAKTDEEKGKPIFKELANTYDKVNDGKLQGIKALRLNLTDYANKLASHPDFTELGKNKALRQEALQERSKVIRFHTFDKNLNTFFVGMDSDYFIHKDLDRFLKTEQRRYIQNTILGDLDTLLNTNPENPTFAIATAFRNVTDEIIALLVAVETFQKQLFLMKKKVVSTDYLISVGKISAATKDNPVQRESLISQILENDAQLADWRETFGIDITEQLPLLDGLYPTLPLDTRHFKKDETFVDKLLALFDDLESQIDGVLLNSENFQALDLLMEKYRGTIKCVHIDPPYNTNTSGFLYKNDYQHSSWLTMMENRLFLAEQLMAPDSCILCHIDENEYENLSHVFNTLPMQNQGTIIWDKRNPVSGANRIATQHEYMVCHSKGNIKLQYHSRNREAILKKAAALVKKYRGSTQVCRDEFRDWLKKNPEFSKGDKAFSRIDEEGLVFQTIHMGAPELRTDPKYFKPLIHPETKKPCPIPKNGWGNTPEFMQGLSDRGLIDWGRDETTQPRQKNYLKDYTIVELSSLISSGEKGKPQIEAFGITFPYCHPVGLYETLVWAVTPEGKGITLDFFAGSGTTGHAILNLNKTDNGNRKFILVEMGHYFENTLKERIRRVMFSQNWKNGKPDANKIDGSVGIVKYQRLEQYEDVLDNLETSAPDYDAKTELPVKYLYRPEEQQIRLMMNMRAPFSNRITYGKDSTEGFVDVLETYCYLKGLSIQRRLRFDFGDQIYRVIQSGKRLSCVP